MAQLTNYVSLINGYQSKSVRGKTKRTMENYTMIYTEIFSEAILKAPVRSQPDEGLWFRIDVLL